MVDGTLSCSAISQWQPENLTHDRALAELRRAQQTHETLLAESDVYNRAVDGMPVRYSVIENYGMGTVELCHLDLALIAPSAERSLLSMAARS